MQDFNFLFSPCFRFPVVRFAGVGASTVSALSNFRAVFLFEILTAHGFAVGRQIEILLK